jgi:hypothetical protein
MHLTSSLISGSAALLVLLPAQCVPGDLDLYIPWNKTTQTLELISEILDYEFTGPPDEIKVNYNFQSIHHIYWLYSKKFEHKINVIVSKTNNTLTPIFEFDSTHPMNFMTAYGLACAYPKLTLQT